MPDNEAALKKVISESAKKYDLIVFSGGTSVGNKDFGYEVVNSLGDVFVRGVAIKPGKPVLFGTVGKCGVFGMPGYPSSCLSNAHILLAPALRRIARLPDQIVRSLTLPLASRVASVPGRHQFYTVRIENGLAVPAFKASGDLTSMSKADGYIEIPAEVEVVDANELVEVKLF